MTNPSPGAIVQLAARCGATVRAGDGNTCRIELDEQQLLDFATELRRAGREVTDRDVRAAQAAAVRGAGDGIEEALRPSGGSLTGAQIAQMTRAIAASIESGHSNLGRSERGEEPNTERGSE